MCIFKIFHVNLQINSLTMKIKHFFTLVIIIISFSITSCKIYSEYEHKDENEVNVQFREPASSSGDNQQTLQDANQQGTQTTPQSQKPKSDMPPPKGLSPAL
jgi:hypothetical protein